MSENNKFIKHNYKCKSKYKNKIKDKNKSMFVSKYFDFLKTVFNGCRLSLITTVLSLVIILPLHASAVMRIPVAQRCPSSPAGYWLTYDTHDGVTPNGVMKMQINKGVLSGALVKVINKSGVRKKARCTKCSGRDHNRILDGMTLITGMRYKKGSYQSGHIFDPRTATTYKGYIRLVSHPCRLLVRGYVGFSLLGKQFTGHR